MLLPVVLPPHAPKDPLSINDISYDPDAQAKELVNAYLERRLDVVQHWADKYKTLLFRPPRLSKATRRKLSREMRLKLLTCWIHLFTP